jgi:hypothetical protein
MKLKLFALAAASAAALAAPASSQAQSLDVGTLCHSLVGSGTTDLGVAEVNRCLAADSANTCILNNTYNVLYVLRIRLGLCFTGSILDDRTAGVDGLASVHLLP